MPRSRSRRFAPGEDSYDTLTDDEEIASLTTTARIDRARR